jgi:hypothetical protein
MNKNYYPHNEATISQWNANFVTQLATTGAELGFTPEEITAITATSNGIVTAITEIEVLKAKLKEQTEVKNTTLDSGRESISLFVKRIKASPSYTEAIGKLLGVIGDGSSFDPSTAMPVIKLTKTGVGYDFAFSLHNYFDAVSIFRKMPNEENFAHVTMDMKSPYSIAPPTVSGVEYYFQYLKDDVLMGLKSDIVVVEL